MSGRRWRFLIAAFTVAAMGEALIVNPARARSDIVSEHKITVRENGHVFTPVLINGVGPFEFLVDTGAAQSAILAHTIDENNLKYRLGGHIIIRGVDGEFRTRELMFESVSIGAFQMQNMRLFGLPDRSGYRDGSMDGILGTDFWALHVVAFNVEREAMRLYPPKTDFLATSPETWDSFPMRWRKQDNGLYTDVFVNGVKARALVDTGATRTSITKDLAKKIGFASDEGEETKTFGVAGRGLSTRIVTVETLSAGTKYWQNVEISIIDRGRLGNNTQVILGMDLLSQTPFAIDYGRHRVLLVKPEMYSK